MSEAQPDTAASTAPDTTPEPQTTAPDAQPAQSWVESLSPGLRESPSIRKFKSVDDLAKSYVELQKAWGQEKMPRPREDWTEKDWEGFFNQIGRPETPEGYEIPEVEVPEGLELDTEFFKSLLPEFHKAGITKAQAERVLSAAMTKLGENWQGLQQRVTQQVVEAEKGLRQEWGTAYEEKVDLARRAFREAARGSGMDAGELAELRLMDGTPLGAHPAIVRAFAKLGEQMAEHGLTGEKGGRLGMTPDEARKEINRLRADQHFNEAWLDKNHPEHADAVQRMSELVEMASAGGEG